MTRRSQLRIASVLSLLGGMSAFACGDSGTDGGPATGGTAAGGAAAGGTNAGGTTAGGTNAGGASGGTPSGGASSGGVGVGGAATGGTSSGGTGTGGAAGGASGGSGAVGGAGGSPAGGSGTGGGGGEPTVLTVQLGEVRQIIRGFGVNATLADTANGQTLPWPQLYRYPLEGENDLGLSILRIGMDGTNADKNPPEVGHRSVPSGWETVKSMGAKVIGSCWSAPASWKDNGKMTNGGHLKSQHYEAWATAIANYAKDNGLYAMSVGNETDFASCSEAAGTCHVAPLTDEYESMVYTGKELAAFVKEAGPIFDSIAPNTKMIAPEASLWIHVWSNLSPTGVGIPDAGHKSSDPLDCECFSNTIDPAYAEANCAAHCKPTAAGGLADGGYDYGHHLAADPAAWAAFDIMGVHEYESQVAYAWPSDVNGGVRDREVWQTEMSGVSHWPEQGPSDTIENGVAVARWIHSAMTVGEASAWLYWWYKSYYNDNNEGLALFKGSDNPVTTPPKTKRYYTLGNFSRYIRPDVFHAVRVAGPSPDKVLVSAYKGDAGEVVVVAINETNQAVDVPIAIAGETQKTAMVPHVTSETQNWAEGTPAPITAGSFQAALPAMSVTTYVGM